jgi:NAD(P)-dependent dehydrogenase (short-subunit alcohol dehydrogenase family)
MPSRRRRWPQRWAPNALWRETLQVNLIAAADLCREAIGHFRERGRGIIVNVTSRAAFRGDAVEHMHYGASKGGLTAFTRSIAREYARDNVLAYTVAPGFTRTDMAEPFIARHGEGAAAGDIPIGEIADPQDVGNIIAFLASGAARHATGANIDVNGASYMH